MNAQIESFNGAEARMDQHAHLSNQIVSDGQYLNYRGTHTADPSLKVGADGTMSFGSAFDNNSTLGKTGASGEVETLSYLSPSQGYWGGDRGAGHGGGREGFADNDGASKVRDLRNHAGSIEKCETGQPPGGSTGDTSGQANLQGMVQEINAIIGAFEQALQQSGGDPTQFWQDFMNDLNQLTNGGGCGGGQNGGLPGDGGSGNYNPNPNPNPLPGGDGNGLTNPPPGNDGGGTNPPPGSDGGNNGGGVNNTGDNAKLNAMVQFDPSISQAHQQQYLQVLDNQPDAVKQALLQSNPTIQILPDQGGGLGGYYDSGSNTIVAYDGQMGPESFGHELFHAADAVTGWSSDPALQQALAKDINNNPGALQLDGTGGGVVGNISLADGPTIQTGQGPVNVGDIFAEASDGITDANTGTSMADQTGTPSYIQQNFPNFFKALQQVENA